MDSLLGWLQKFLSFDPLADRSDILSFLALIITLAVAFQSYRLTRVIAAAQFKPYLSITPFHYIDDKYITLENVGIGTAVINEVVIEKNGKRVFNMIDLFEFKKEVIWDEYRSFGTEVDYLAAGDSIDLVKLSLENLISQKI